MTNGGLQEARDIAPARTALERLRRTNMKQRGAPGLDLEIA